MIFSTKKSQVNEALDRCEYEQYQYKRKIEELRKLQPQDQKSLEEALEEEYKLKEEALEDKLQELEEDLAYKLSLVLEFMKVLEMQASQSLDNFAKYLTEFMRVMSISYRMQDRLIINGTEDKNITTPSWQVTPSWQNLRWWETNEPNSYIPRAEGLAAGVIRTGMVRYLQKQGSTFLFDCGGEFDQMLQETGLFDINLRDLPFLLQCRSSNALSICAELFIHLAKAN